jgi:DNA-binding NarL/FixJ family response regulator
VAIQVGVLEDDPVQRGRYAELIGCTTDMALLWECAGVDAALRTLAHAVPDVLLVDLGLPDGSGLQVIRRVHGSHPTCETMVVSVFGDEENVVAAIEAGAGGYLLKDSMAEQFLQTIRDLHGGGSPISPSVARILLTRAQATHAGDQPALIAGMELGARESQILSLVAKGFNFGEVGRLLGISAADVQTHIYRIYRKVAAGGSRDEAEFEASKPTWLD